MEYSPIKSIRVKNFRNIGDVRLSFEESPIITLMGENEAGKTSIVKAMAVAGANAYPARQARFVRTGTNGFGIQVDFADGSCLIRQKGGQGVGNTLQVLTPDGRLLRDDKIDRGEGIPVNMQKLMGFMVEPETGELLHVRTYEDALMFVVTADSTNYKVMYNALKVGQITRAIKAGNQKANSIKAEINNNGVKIEGIHESLKSIRLVDIEPAVQIKARLEEQMNILGLISQAVGTLKSLRDAQEKLGILALIDQNNLSEIPTRGVENLNRALELYRGLKQAGTQADAYSELGNAAEVQVQAATKLADTLAIQSKLRGLVAEAATYEDLHSLSPVETNVIDKLAGARRVLSQLSTEQDKITTWSQLESLEIVDTATLNCIINIINEKGATANRVRELTELRRSMTECVSEIHHAGGKVGTCTSCGQLVVVIDGEELGSCEHGDAN